MQSWKSYNQNPKINNIIPIIGRKNGRKVEQCFSKSNPQHSEQKIINNKVDKSRNSSINILLYLQNKPFKKLKVILTEKNEICKRSESSVFYYKIFLYLMSIQCLILYSGQHFFVQHKVLGLYRQQVMNHVMKQYESWPDPMGDCRQPRWESV